jgi:hypothetical protein
LIAAGLVLFSLARGLIYFAQGPSGAQIDGTVAGKSGAAEQDDDGPRQVAGDHHHPARA